MASVCITWVVLQAVLLLDINCIPVKHGLAPLYKGGSSKGGSAGGGSSKGGSSKGGSAGGGSQGAVFYQPEEHVDPGYVYEPGHHKSSASSQGGSTGGGSSKGAVFYQPEEHVDPGYVYEPGHHKSSASSQGGSTGGGSSKGAVFYQPEEHVDPGYVYEPGHHKSSASSQGGSTGGGSSKGAVFYQPEEHVDPGYFYQPGHHKSSASSQAVPWAVPPPPIFSGGKAGPSTSNAGYMELGLSKTSPPHPPSPPEPQLIPGELYHVENTLEDGGYESETQERGPPPPSHPYADFVARPPNSMPGGSFGYGYPYDWGFIRGQYPVGTYTHSSSSVERGSDYWQDNHYIRYDYPASPEEEEGGQVQTFPSLSD